MLKKKIVLGLLAFSMLGFQETKPIPDTLKFFFKDIIVKPFGLFIEINEEKFTFRGFKGIKECLRLLGPQNIINFESTESKSNSLKNVLMFLTAFYYGYSGKNFKFTTLNAFWFLILLAKIRIDEKRLSFGSKLNTNTFIYCSILYIIGKHSKKKGKVKKLDSIINKFDNSINYILVKADKVKNILLSKLLRSLQDMEITT